MAVTGSIGRLLKDKGSVPIVENIRLPAALQIIFFLVATVLLVIYGWIAIWGLQKKSDSRPGIDQTGD